jgi:hypothetical protein
MKEPLATSLNVSIIARGNATLLVIGDGGNKSDYEAVATVLEMMKSHGTVKISHEAIQYSPTELKGTLVLTRYRWDCQGITRGYPIQSYRAEWYSCFHSLPSSH